MDSFTYTAPSDDELDRLAAFESRADDATSKSAIYSTDVYGTTAYNAKCLEPGCKWESRRFDRIKQAQDAAAKHAESHFKAAGKRSQFAPDGESRGQMPEDPIMHKGKTWYLTGKTGPAPGNYKEQVWELEAVTSDGKERPTGEKIWMNAYGRIYSRGLDSSSVEERASGEPAWAKGMPQYQMPKWGSKPIRYKGRDYVANGRWGWKLNDPNVMTFQHVPVGEEHGAPEWFTKDGQYAGRSADDDAESRALWGLNGGFRVTYKGTLYANTGRIVVKKGVEDYNSVSGGVLYEMIADKKPAIWIDRNDNVYTSVPSGYSGPRSQYRTIEDDGSLYSDRSAAEDYEQRGLYDIIQHKGKRYRNEGESFSIPLSSGARAGRVWKFTRVNDDNSTRMPVELLFLDWDGKEFDLFKYKYKAD
jgi:hypothetical protein